MSKKLYSRNGGAFIDTGYHLSDIQELRDDNIRLKALFRIACEVLARDDIELDADGHRLMIERCYEDMKAEGGKGKNEENIRRA
jgi:hypothetical protein